MLDALVGLPNVAGYEHPARVAQRAGEHDGQLEAAMPVLGHRVAGRDAEQPHVGALVGEHERQMPGAGTRAGARGGCRGRRCRGSCATAGAQSWRLLASAAGRGRRGRRLDLGNGSGERVGRRRDRRDRVEQYAANGARRRRPGAAGGAEREMGGDGEAVAFGERSRFVSDQQFIAGVVADGLSACPPLMASAARRRAKARRTRDLTVPRGMPSSLEMRVCDLSS